MESLTKYINPKSLINKGGVIHLTLNLSLYKSEVSNKPILQFFPKTEIEKNNLNAWLEMAKDLGFEICFYDIQNQREIRLTATRR